MGNYSPGIRAKRWYKYLFNYLNEKIHGLDFSMVYVGGLQRSVDDYHGYSMTDAGDLKNMLRAVPVDPGESAFLDIGCGKGMCLKCAAEVGYKKVAGLDLDRHLLDIAHQNLAKLKIKADYYYASAEDFLNYTDYDVFYFYNPFGEYEITPEESYTDADLNYNDGNSRTSIEMNDPNSRPAISGSVEDMGQYDVVFVGYPIWWGDAPHILYTFMESYDWSGKTIVPFCTSGSSPIGSSGANLESLAPGASWTAGRRFSASVSQDELVQWANSLVLGLTDE